MPQRRQLPCQPAPSSTTAANLASSIPRHQDSSISSPLTTDSSPPLLTADSSSSLPTDSNSPLHTVVVDSSPLTSSASSSRANPHTTTKVSLQHPKALRTTTARSQLTATLVDPQHLRRTPSEATVTVAHSPRPPTTSSKRTGTAIVKPREPQLPLTAARTPMVVSSSNPMPPSQPIAPTTMVTHSTLPTRNVSVQLRRQLLPRRSSTTSHPTPSLLTSSELTNSHHPTTSQLTNSQPLTNSQLPKSTSMHSLFSKLHQQPLGVQARHRNTWLLLLSLKTSLPLTSALKTSRRITPTQLHPSRPDHPRVPSDLVASADSDKLLDGNLPPSWVPNNFLTTMILTVASPILAITAPISP